MSDQKKLVLLNEKLNKLMLKKSTLQQKKDDFNRKYVTRNYKLTAAQLKAKELLKDKRKVNNANIAKMKELIRIANKKGGGWLSLKNKPVNANTLQRSNSNELFKKALQRVKVENLPFIENDKFWKSLPNGDQVLSCETNKITCFPYNINSTVPCLPSCIFTDNKGFNEYTGFDYFLKGKTKTNNKTIIITYGPPASGKGSLQRVFQDLGKDNANIVDVNVDMIFQNAELQIGQNYNEQLKAIQTKYQLLGCDKTQIKKYTQRLYFYYRLVADQVSDMLLYKAMLNELDIKWETAGGQNTTYLRSFISDKIDKGYKVIIIYPVVSFEKLKDRIQKRQEATGQEDATPEKIQEMINNAKTGIQELDLFNKKEHNNQIDIIILNNDKDRGYDQPLSLEDVIYRTKEHIGLTEDILNLKLTQGGKKIRKKTRKPRQ